MEWYQQRKPKTRNETENKRIIKKSLLKFGL